MINNLLDSDIRISFQGSQERKNRIENIYRTANKPQTEVTSGVDGTTTAPVTDTKPINIPVITPIVKGISPAYPLLVVGLILGYVFFCTKTYKHI